MTATFSADFKHEFEQERSSWLRKRFLWYTGILACLNIIQIVGLVFVLVDVEMSALLKIVSVMLGVGNVLIYAAPFMYVLRSQVLLEYKEIVQLLFWIIIINGFYIFLSQIVGGEVGAKLSSVSATGEPSPMQNGAAWLGGVFLSHFIASLFIPWTPREALRPMLYLLIAFNTLVILGIFFTTLSLLQGLGLVALSTVPPLPGMAIAWWRHSRFKDRFHYKALRGRYGQMKRELVDARKLHESLFPPPIDSGSVRFSYSYEPMRQIGGDFLFTHTFPTLGVDDDNEPVSIVLVDVTGHGIPAALTVNRLHGELERIFGEDPDIGPGEVLRMLNRYVHLTLSRHSVYATALCLRVDPRGHRIAWASGGHPPAFLRGVDGTLTELGSTALVLGAVTGSDFDPGEESHPFVRGDGLIAYTDGAIESKNAKGQMLRIEGLRAILASVVPDPGMDGWAGAILREIDMYRHGPAEDDTLVVELFRPLVSMSAGKPPREGNSEDQSQLGEPTSIAERS
ncbi:MAG: PP2C family protein-serine/threonine phosphatase [Planctomycetota bacterium]|jgi:serine phosphatase RsbU (regulator of sigma subunit)